MALNATRKRRRPGGTFSFSIKSASNLILALLILHWAYMMCRIFHHSPQQPQPIIVELPPLFPKNVTNDPPHKPYPFNFTWKWHPRNRSQRFPSVEERVKLYMGNWFLPVCNDTFKISHSIKQNDSTSWPRVVLTDANNNNSMELDSFIQNDKIFLLDRDTLVDCARTFQQYQREGDLPCSSRIKKRQAMQSYCSEVVPLVDFIGGLDSFVPKASYRTPIIANFGDKPMNHTAVQIPIINKWRAATTKQKVTKATSGKCIDSSIREPLVTTHKMHADISPIIWKLELGRHWDPLEFARSDDTHWEHKKLGALWRGDLTGKHLTEIYTDEQVCFGNQRCRFVFHHRNSQLIDAGLSDGIGWFKGNGNISGVPIIKERVSMQQIQKYKVIISMEGNDVASGLKWSLLSESVVLMPTPTRTSWAMEELLEPWIHYIPMHANGSNAEEMIEWVGSHDKEAKKIAERGRLFIYDLVYHPDAAKEEGEIKQEIARRYRALFQ